MSDQAMLIGTISFIVGIVVGIVWRPDGANVISGAIGYGVGYSIAMLTVFLWTNRKGDST